MNKSIRTVYMVIIAICVLSVITAPAFSQTAKLGTANLSDFTFASLHDGLLYPETAYYINPAVLMRVKKNLLFIDTDIFFARTEETLERLSDAAGLAGGTFTSAGHTLNARVSFALFSPQKTKKSEHIFGLTFNTAVENDDEQNTYNDYNSYSERMKTTLTDVRWNAGSDVFYAAKAGTLPVGFMAGYTYDYLPKLYRMSTDSSVNPPVTFAQENIRNAAVKTHFLRSSLGTTFPLSTVAEWSLSLIYNGAIVDASERYRAFDSNGDGRNDKVVREKEYYSTSAADGGPAIEVTDYDSRDLGVNTDLTLHPSLRMYLMKDIELLFSGEYTVLGLRDRNAYEHITKVTDLEEDESRRHEVYDNSLTSFAVMPGLIIRTGATSLLKLGIGFRQNYISFRQDGLTAAGINAYSRLNPDNYTELSGLTVEPKNDSISKSGIPPTTDVRRTIFFRMGWENKLSNTISMFFRSDVAAGRRERVWNVYNLDTRSVWTEKEQNDAIEWNVVPVMGLSFSFGKTGLLTIDIGRSGFSGATRDKNGNGIASETAPFGTVENRRTNNGDTDLRSSFPFTLDLHAGLTYSF